MLAVQPNCDITSKLASCLKDCLLKQSVHMCMFKANETSSLQNQDLFILLHYTKQQTLSSWSLSVWCANCPEKSLGCEKTLIRYYPCTHRNKATSASIYNASRTRKDRCELVQCGLKYPHWLRWIDNSTAPTLDLSFTHFSTKVANVSARGR